MLQRKRPHAAVGGASVSTTAPTKKKAKLVPAVTASPLPAGAYAQLAKSVLASRVSATAPLPVVPPSPLPRPGCSVVPTPTSPSATDALADTLSSADEPSDGELPDNEGEAVQLSASAVISSGSSSPSRAVVPSAAAAAAGRVPAPSLSLQQLHFLLSSAHSLALTAPSLAQRLIRLMRAAAAAQSIDLHPDVRSRICSQCSAVLLPGVNCSQQRRVDEERTERWVRKQKKRLDKKERRLRASAAADASTPTPATDVPPTEVPRPVQEKRRTKVSAKERKKAEKIRLRAERERAVQPVRFYHSVVRCAHCGCEGEVDGSRVKRGGRHPPDLRNQSGDRVEARAKRRPAATSISAKPSADVSATAGDAELEEKKAAKQRQRLQRQQRLAHAQSQQQRGGKADSAAPASSSDPFAGSLFFRFQRPVSSALQPLTRLRAARHLRGVAAQPLSPRLLSVSQGKQGVVAEASSPSTSAVPVPSPAARPFSFSHPSTAAKPSASAAPFVHTRAPAAPALTLLEAAAKKKKEDERERKKREKLLGPSTPALPPASANPSPTPTAIPPAGLYSLLQSFKR